MGAKQATPQLPTTKTKTDEPTLRLFEPLEHITIKQAYTVLPVHWDAPIVLCNKQACGQITRTVLVVRVAVRLRVAGSGSQKLKSQESSGSRTYKPGTNHRAPRPKNITKSIALRFPELSIGPVEFLRLKLEVSGLPSLKNYENQ